MFNNSRSTPRNVLFDWIARWYDRFMPRPDVQSLQTVLDIDGSDHSKTLLEIGGGTGRVAAQLHRFLTTIILIDLSRPMLEQARRKGLTLLALARAEAIPMRDASCHRIMIVDALHHFRDQQQALRESTRVLKPGGLLLIEEPDITTTVVKIIALLEKMAMMRSYFTQPEEIRAMMENCGLQTSIREASRFTTWIVGRKPS